MIPTRDHKLIREWAARNNAKPVELKRLKFDGQPAILSFITGNPDAETPDINLISWESFFAQFDVLQLAMAFDEGTARFNIVKVDKPLTKFAN